MAKNPRRLGLKLSEGKEIVVFEFVEAHPQLFDKNNPGFMRRGDKEALWKKCVEDNEIVESDSSPSTGARLSVWFSNMRTTFGKATRDVSGSGRKKHTPREEWLTRKLAFLSSHVYRVPLRSGVNQLKQRHPDRFDTVVTDGHGQDRETGKETEETRDVCDEEEEPVGTGPPFCSKRRKTATATAASTVMERIEHRVAAQTRAQQQLLEKEETAHMAFGHMIGLAAGELYDKSWDTYQLEVNQCLVKARRETRERRKDDESRRHLQPQADFAFVSNIAAQQQQQCVHGNFQDWQHQFQPPPAQRPAQPQARSASAPAQGSTPYSFGDMLTLE